MLRTHASTFTTITSIPATVDQTGDEPHLPTTTRRLLFSVAHNAMTNSFRHANAGWVKIALAFGEASLQMTILEDGIGLPDDYQDRGHGFRNMRTDVERLEGRLEIARGESGRGTAVTVIIPLRDSPMNTGGR